MGEYSIIRVYTSEKARYEGKDLSQTIESYIRSLKIAARCVILRGSGGCYEGGETATTRIVELSYDLPLIIEIILPQVDAKSVLDRLDAMVVDGVVALLPATVTSYRSSASLVPKNLRVRDIMTRNPVCAHADFPVRSAAEILFDNGFKSLPVVDMGKRCVGILTQGDLMARAGMPVRLGLMRLLPEHDRERWLRSCEELRCDEVMTKSPKTVKEDARLSDAIKTMNREKLKRLPVLDDRGSIVGVLSRIDILRAIAATKGLQSASEASAGDGYARYVEELTDRDTLSLQDSVGLKSAIDTLIASGEQRAAVVDSGGRLVGIITDQMLLRALGGQIAGAFPFGLGRRTRRAARPISGIMERDLKVATEKMSVYEALGLMTEYGLKRVPVVDADNAFRGMIRRDSILVSLSRLWDASAP
jgi:CBS domain-containing protein/PII-like signaling protein